MEICALDIFSVAITLIRLVLIFANSQRTTTNSDCARRSVYTNPTPFDIMRETK